MIVQNVVFPDEVCDMQALYFRTDGYCNRKKHSIELQPGQCLSTDTYMNVLDMEHWKKHTCFNDLSIHIQAEGHFKICFIVVCAEKQIVLFERVCNTQKIEIICWELSQYLQEGLLFFRIEALEKTFLFSAEYTTQTHIRSNIRLAVDICTFHRNEQLEKNLRKIRDSLFFDEKSELYGRLHIYVIDNGNDFQPSFQSRWIKIYRNSNHGGGTGGFTRGLEEIRNHYQEFPCTHTVFMDDDVEFQMESFYRMYAFFSLVRPEKSNLSLAGRMFRMDQRNIQYTAVERWNMGNILHVGGNVDMCLPVHETYSLNPSGEYGGWWMCAYPAEISLKNVPFPFFIHCDDVEYGLRQKKEVLTLNGIQVWHETYEYRISLKILYYDIRNPIVVNVMQGEISNASQLITIWKQKMDEFHNAGKQAEKYLCALALWHFGRGRIFKHPRGQIPEFHLWLSQRERLLKMITPVFHRIAEKYVRRNFVRIVERYKKCREEMIWQ